jgi:hypothetical protein
VFDEVTRAWQSTVDRWHVGFCDLSGGQGLLGRVEGRTAQVVIDWLGQRDQRWRDGVRFVAIDMCTIFKSAVGRVLPNAVLVVDHFHLVQLANQTVTKVRRRVTVQVRGRCGRKGNREWELRNRLARSAARMRGEHVDALCDELSRLPAAIAAPIPAACNAKEDLLDLLALARTQPDREQIARLLYRFSHRCAESGLPELDRLASTVQTWWPEILAFLHTGITNAGSEGTNTVIKTVAGRLRLPQPRQPATTNTLRDDQERTRTTRPPLTSESRKYCRLLQNPYPIRATQNPATTETRVGYLPSVPAVRTAGGPPHDRAGRPAVTASPSGSLAGEVSSGARPPAACGPRRGRRGGIRSRRRARS